MRTSLCWLALDQPEPKPQVASDLGYAWAKTSKLTSSYQSFTEALCIRAFKLRDESGLVSLSVELLVYQGRGVVKAAEGKIQ